ncbi:hypothetical protein PSOL_06190 [Candidatus Phytoplasma solani]
MSFWDVQEKPHEIKPKIHIIISNIFANQNKKKRLMII